MIRPVETLDTYKYTISNITLSAPDFEEPIIIEDTKFISLSIIKDYEKNIVPLMLLRIHVNKEDYERVITSMRFLTTSFTVYKTKVKSTDDNNLAYNTPYISGIFKSVNNDSMDINTPNLMKSSITTESNDSQSSLEVNLYLYDFKNIIKYKKNFSYLVEATVNDVLFTMLKDRNFNNILMSPSLPNNTDNIIVPFGPLNENLDFLDKYYGIYDTPRLFFSDFDTTYLIEKGAVGKTVRKGELPTVFMYLEKDESMGLKYNGSYTDLENGIYILSAPPFIMDDNDTLIDFYDAGKIISLISGTSEKYEDTIGEYDIEKAYSVENLKTHKQMLFTINSNKRNMSLEFADVDLDIITPNKKYKLIPDSFYDSEYDIKGDYRLTKSMIVFSKQSENMIKSTVQCSFSKLQ